MYYVFWQNTDQKRPKTFVFKLFRSTQTLLKTKVFGALLICILPDYGLREAEKLLFSNVFYILPEYGLRDAENLCF